MFRNYFRSLYQRTMSEAYELAHSEVSKVLEGGGNCLDCGAGQGATFGVLSSRVTLAPENYKGVEWDEESVAIAQRNGLDIIQGDLNQKLPFSNDSFSCVFGLSALEHLLFPCRFIQECKRVLEPGGSLILLTPNISTFFTAVLILLGKMPSSGPHPDSDLLIASEEVIKVSSDRLTTDADEDTPRHRHLVVFSYRVLYGYLKLIGFEVEKSRGFGLYPFPNALQPLMEKVDPYHCHQMVFVAKKRID